MFVSRRFWVLVSVGFVAALAAGVAVYNYDPFRPKYYRATEPKHRWTVHYADREKIAGGTWFAVLESGVDDPVRKMGVFYIDPEPAFTVNDVVGTNFKKHESEYLGPEFARHSVGVMLRPEAAPRLAAVSRRALQNKADARLAIYLDGEHFHSAVVESELTGGCFVLSLPIGHDEAEALAKTLAGY